MRFLANENVPRDVVAALRSAGRDVVWVREDAPGHTDIQVIERGRSEGRILLTFDKDFGEIAFHQGLPPSSGVILFRVPMPPGGRASANLVQIINSRDDWEGSFSVVEPGRIRMRALPHRG